MEGVGELAKSLLDLGLSGVLLAFAIILWKDVKSKDERYEKLNERLISVISDNAIANSNLKGAIDNNTRVIERVDNFIRYERGDS